MSMSSKSLTAVTSFVSVIRDKTVFVLRLNVKGCQRVAVPIAMIVSYLLAVGLLVAAGATDQMIRLSLSVNGTGEEKGDLHFGLFRGAHSVSPRISSSDDEPDTNDYLIYKVFNNEDIIGMYTATVGVGLTVILCAISAGFSFFNTFGAYTSWLYGPPMLYVLALTSAFMGALSTGVVSDYYLWEVDDNSASIVTFSLPSNLKYLASVYVAEPSLEYSFWLLCGGFVFSLISFLLSWRLLVLLPEKPHAGPIEPSHSAYELSEQPQTHFDPTAPAHVYY